MRFWISMFIFLSLTFSTRHSLRRQPLQRELCDDDNALCDGQWRLSTRLSLSAEMTTTVTGTLLRRQRTPWRERTPWSTHSAGNALCDGQRRFSVPKEADFFKLIIVSFDLCSILTFTFIFVLLHRNSAQLTVYLSHLKTLDYVHLQSLGI